MWTAIWIGKDNQYVYGKHPVKGERIDIADSHLMQCINEHLIDPTSVKYVGWHGHDTLKFKKHTIVTLPKTYLNVENELRTISIGIKRVGTLLEHYSRRRDELIDILRQVQEHGPDVTVRKSR